MGQHLFETSRIVGIFRPTSIPVRLVAHKRDTSRLLRPVSRADCNRLTAAVPTRTVDMRPEKTLGPMQLQAIPAQTHRQLRPVQIHLFMS